MTDGDNVDRLCELNVLEQAANVCRTTIVQDAWRRGQPLQVHGWIYRLQNGLIHDLGLSVAGDAMLDAAIERSLQGLVG
jgi:carbonic anhydrase